MPGKKIGYVRVSTVDQNPERQLEGIELDKKFIDYVSGSTIDRPQLKALIEYAREDDVLYVHSLDRLGRKLIDILRLLDHFISHKIQVHFIKENLHFTGQNDAVANCVLGIFAVVAEFEHSILKERQLEGIAIAKKAGKYKGTQSKLTLLLIEKIKERLQTRKTITQIAKELSISRWSLYKYIKKIEEQDGQIYLAKRVI